MKDIECNCNLYLNYFCISNMMNQIMMKINWLKNESLSFKWYSRSDAASSKPSVPSSFNIQCNL